jgi:hypothetical protein
MREDVLGGLFAELAAAELPVPTPARVVARGRQRRRRARDIAVSAIAAVVALAVAGASQLAGSLPGTREATGHGRSPQAVCTAAATAGLALEMRHELPLSNQRSAVPIAVSPDGTAVYVQTSTQRFHGIAEESLATGAILRKIDPLPAAYEGLQGGLSPAGELVWTSSYSTHGGEAYAYTPMQAWSPLTGTSTTLEPAGQHGDAMGAPVFLNQAIVAWEQTDGSQQEIVEANLAAGSTDVIARGYLGPPVFVGTALVWPVASRANGPASRLVARNAAVFPARQQIAVPAQLRAAGQASLMGSSSQGTWATPVGLIASSGPATAYLSPDLTRLFYSPSPSQPARLVLRLRGGNAFVPGGLALGDGYLGWTVNGDGSYLASTTTLAATRITSFGSVTGVGTDYVVVGGPPVTKLSQLRPYYLFSGSTVSRLTCAGRATAGRG